MELVKIVPCTESGQGYCDRCKSLGRYSDTRMVFLNRIVGLREYDGTYCSECAKVIVFEYLANLG